MQYLTMGGPAGANPMQEAVKKQQKKKVVQQQQSKVNPDQAIIDQVMQGIASEPIPLSDGSGQQVGTYGKNEQLEKVATRQKVFKKLKDTKDNIVSGKEAPKEEPKKDIKKNAPNTPEDTDTEDTKEKKKFELSKSTDPNAAAMENAMNMSEIDDNPFAIGGAVLIGGLQAEEARKQANRDIDVKKGEAAYEGKSEKAKLYSKLAGSFKGMLS